MEFDGYCLMRQFKCEVAMEYTHGTFIFTGMAHILINSENNPMPYDAVNACL